MPQVRERMTSSVVTIEPTATVVDAAKGDRLVGIISEADLPKDEGPLA
jgi:CBS domain-containing protein